MIQTMKPCFLFNFTDNVKLKEKKKYFAYFFSWPNIKCVRLVLWAPNDPQPLWINHNSKISSERTKKKKKPLKVCNYGGKPCNVLSKKRNLWTEQSQKRTV